MKPYWESDNGQTLLRLRLGNVLDVLRGLPPGFVQTVVTSPPYWALRDYGLPPAMWGGDQACDHEWAEAEVVAEAGKGGNWQQGENGPGLRTGRPQTRFRGDWRAARADGVESVTLRQGTCVRCGAWLGTLGLEPTPEMYVEHVVQVFREVRRVMRDDGTLWLNMGDTYYNAGTGGHGATGGRDKSTLAGPLPPEGTVPVNRGIRGSNDEHKHRGRRQVGDNKNPKAGVPELGANRTDGAGDAWRLKAKDMIGMPWRVAFALQADGWWLRSDVVWSKPNPMPESVVDRPTKAHEYLFLLSKSERYFYDADAIREPHKAASMERYAYAAPDGRINKGGAYRDAFEGSGDTGITGQHRMLPKVPRLAPADSGQTSLAGVAELEFVERAPAVAGDHPRNPENNAEYQAPGQRARHIHSEPEWRDKTASDPSAKGRRQAPEPGEPNAFHPMGRNKRTVWEIPTQPFPEAHFATFPEALVEPCVLAGTSAVGCCPDCGAPWRHTVEASGGVLGKDWNSYGREKVEGAPGNVERQRYSFDTRASVPYSRSDMGYGPSCGCGGDGGPFRPIPCWVLDPFVGSGTTLLVAQRLGRSGEGVDLSEKYLEIAVKRVGPAHSQSRLDLFGGVERTDDEQEF